MQIQPILSSTFNTRTVQFNRNESTSHLGLSSEDIQRLLPSSQKKSVSNIWDIIPTPEANNSFFPLAQILNHQYKLKIMLLEFNQNTGVDTDSGDDYERYLQFYNANIASLAHSIVDRSDSNDEKIYKIEQWVIENIEYVLDIHNYGMNEYWATPTLTILREQGDCEDGAFLIHSLALHAGVPIDRLRTYGGFVELEEGIPLLGGHGWTAYKRESDDEWVEVDWCYYPTDTSLAERTAMKNDTKYVDDFFYVDALKTVDASLVNRIRKPVSGGLINTYA